ncbi:hypothetical protein [Rhizobium rhizosphaerae]|nr:hypothetical protein [Xaviernesmea rhizosphaerae]
MPLLLAAAPVHAEDRSRLIWSPERTAERSYRLRMGVKLDDFGAATAGTDLAVSTNRSGRILSDEPPIAVWGSFSGTSGSGLSRHASARLETRRGAFHGDIGRRRTIVLSTKTDLTLERELTLDCHLYSGRCQTVLLQQTARLLEVKSGTALVARSRMDGLKFDLEQSLGVEQRLGRLTLRASLDDLQQQPQPSLSANMRLRW